MSGSTPLWITAAPGAPKPPSLPPRCVITESSYTAGENFDIADVVFDCIGDAGDERFGLDDLTTPGMQALAASKHARR